LYPENEAFSLALLPLYIQDEPTGFMAFDAGHLEPCADIVRQLAAALRSVRLYREALEGRRLAEEANRLKSRFLSIVSHELRMPLNVISGLTDILLQEGLASGSERCTVGREDLERIYASAQHLDSLICDVLDLTRSEMGRLELECEPLDLSEPLRAVAAMGQLLAEDKGLGFRAEIADSLPSVWGDRARLRQVALNLVSNAIKFTNQGQVTLAATATGGQVRVTVQDTGLGIPPEEQVAIFDEFRQSERTAALGYGGLGLGLAICRRLVELHGGGIGVESSGKEGDGSTFYFTLPTLADAPKASPTASTCQGQSVLLLAEELEGGKTLADHLTGHGFQVEMQHLDECPEDWAGLLENPPAAVILDRTLASKQGWQIIESLKGNPATSGVQVLFYSLKDEEDIGSLLQVDCTAAPMQAAALERILVGRKPTDDNEPNRIPNSLLLVDDDPDTLETQSRIIKAGYPGCRLSLARDGRDALAQMRQDRPDLVLLDLMMPELDGFQVLEAMRQDERCRNTPVIVFTGRTLTEEDMRRLNHGVSSILQKGIFTVDETLQHIRAALSARERLADERRGTVRKALAYLHEHYAEQLSRGDIARFAGVSERHLSRCFRQEMGVTLVTYLRRYRVKQARELLDARDKNVTEVAMASGFSSSSYFARVFRQEVGMPPSAYLVNRR